MKQAFLFSKLIYTFLFLSLYNLAFSQVDQTAELEVRINPILTFTINDANPTLIFDEANDFINGVTYVANNAGVITASAPFSLKVKAVENHLTDDANNKIKVNSIFLEVNGDNIGSTTKISLNTSKKEIISGAIAGISKSFNLVYSTEGNDTEFIGKPAGDYTVDLIFIVSLD